MVHEQLPWPWGIEPAGLSIHHPRSEVKHNSFTRAWAANITPNGKFTIFIHATYATHAAISVLEYPKSGCE
jgi:hypothetical protein